MNSAITIQHVSKRYRIGGLHPGYMTFREMLGGMLTSPFKKARPAMVVRRFGRLSDINLKIERGELVGIMATTAPASRRC